MGVVGGTPGVLGLDDGPSVTVASEGCGQTRHSFIGPSAQPKDDITQHSTADDILEYGYQMSSLPNLPPNATSHISGQGPQTTNQKIMIILLVLFVTQKMTEHMQSTTSPTRSSTLPIGSRDALERAHMGGNIHLYRRH